MYNSKIWDKDEHEAEVKKLNRNDFHVYMLVV